MKTQMKPYSEACARNQGPILNVLRDVFAESRHVLEIGSGTGQHAVFFGSHLPHLRWQTSDLSRNHAGIHLWLEEANLPNVLPPLVIDANDPTWPVNDVDAVFSANVVHIMNWEEVVKMFTSIGRVLTSDGTLCLYGPFNYGGKFTSESNEQFDLWLKANNPLSGIRDFEALNELARREGLRLLEDVELPSNNRCLVWRRQA
jgi:SAM-dependent methyltransferase